MRILAAVWLAAAALCVAAERPRLVLTVDPAAALRPGDPVTADLDLQQPGRRSYQLTQAGKAIPFRLSEPLEQGRPKGSISWTVRDPRKREFELEIKDGAIGDRPPVGAGDAVHYNRPDGFDPLTMGMKNDQPIAVDWDGDGRTDLLCRNLYSTAFGEPWWGLYFFRNIGSNAAPRFDRAILLTTDNGAKTIADPYASYQLFDADNDGLQDVVAGVGAGPERGKLKVYRNTGQRDSQRMPVLVPSSPLSWRQPGGDLTYGMRMLLGDLFSLRLRVEYFPNQIVESTLFRHANDGHNNFGSGQPVHEVPQNDWPSTLFDIDGDGKPEWIGSSRGGPENPLKTCIVAWTGGATKCLIDVTPEGFVVPAAADTPAFRGLLASRMGGWLQYFAWADAGAWAKPQLLLAQGMPVSSGGYSSVDVVDFDGDGDLDFIAGNETGFIQWIENISTKGRTMFATARPIPLTDGTSMYAARWQFIADADPERPLGQSKPAVVDWDGDGDLDILVGNNSNRIAYFENVGGRRFAPYRILEHDGGPHFSFRSRPAPVDWNHDGLMDLIAGSAGPRDRNDSKDIAICLYLRYRDPSTGRLRLRDCEALRGASGQELRTPIPYHHGFEAVDWDGDGDIDILACERTQAVLYRNNGHNRFDREILQFRGAPLSISHHETSLKAVDWDGDGRLDLIAGGESGWVYYLHRSTLTSAPGPKVEVRVRAASGRSRIR